MAYGEQSSNEDWADYAEGETVKTLSAALERLITAPVHREGELTEAEAERLQDMFLSDATEPGVTGYGSPDEAPQVELVVQDTNHSPVLVRAREPEVDVRFEGVIEPDVIELGSSFEDGAPAITAAPAGADRIIDLEGEEPVALKVERPVSPAGQVGRGAIGEYRSGPRLIKLHLDNVEGAARKRG